MTEYSTYILLKHMLKICQEGIVLGDFLVLGVLLGLECELCRFMNHRKSRQNRATYRAIF